MTKALRYRLFGMGKMPPILKEAAERADVLLADEGLSVKQTVDHLKMPRASVRHGVKLIIGAAVLLPDRLLASIGRHLIVDTDFRPSGHERQTLTLAEDGVHLTMDVADVLKGTTGSVEVHYRVTVPADVLAQMPARSVQVSVHNAGPGLLNGWKGTWSR